MNNDRPRTKLFIVIALVVSVLFVAYIGSTSGRRSEDPQAGGEYIAGDSPAFLVFEDKPFFPIGKPTADTMFREDVALFARKNYKQYDPKSQPGVVFYVDEHSRLGSKINLTGHYEKVGGSVKISITVLKNNRITLSITDSKNKNIDTQLVSNSPLNQFIGTLPVDKEAFSIDYTESADSFTITLRDGTAATQTIAENFLKDSLKVDSLSGIRYGVVVPRDSGTRDSPDFQ